MNLVWKKNHLHVELQAKINKFLVTCHDYADFTSYCYFCAENQLSTVVTALYIYAESLPLWCESQLNLVKCTLPGEL